MLYGCGRWNAVWSKMEHALGPFIRALIGSSNRCSTHSVITVALDPEKKQRAARDVVCLRSLTSIWHAMCCWHSTPRVRADLKMVVACSESTTVRKEQGDDPAPSFMHLQSVSLLDCKHLTLDFVQSSHSKQTLRLKWWYGSRLKQSSLWQKTIKDMWRWGTWSLRAVATTWRNGYILPTYQSV